MVTFGMSTFITFGGIRPTSQTATNIMAATYCFALQLMMLCVSVQFFYRYLIIVRKVYITNFLYFAMLMPPVIVATSITAYFFYAIQNAPSCAEKFLFYLKENSQEGFVPCVQFNIKIMGAKVLLIITTNVMVTEAIIIIIFNLLVYRYLSQKAAFTSTENSIQQQLSATLIAQLCVTGFCAFVPAICMLVNAILATEMAWLPVFSVCVLSLSPVVNPVFTVFTVKSYRKVVVYVIKKYVLRRPGATVEISNVILRSATK
uniref:G-protein coupled receptors family 1 profile domain-containing protein n=1 Tax=Panagrellus redivivus TaxID=6233 RepID=A0A7E4VE05_PANRE